MTLFLSLQPSSYEGFVKTTLAAIKLLTNLGFVIHRQRLQSVKLGYIVFSFPAIRYGECHDRGIEHDKIIALKTAKGNFDVRTHLSSRAVR